VYGVLESLSMPATLAHAFANRAIRYGNYPIVGTMVVDVLRELALVLWRRYDALVHPALGRLKRYAEFDGEVSYGEPVHG